MKKGIDAPFVPVLFIVAGVLGIIPTNSHNPYNFIFPVIMITMAVLFIHTSLFGKYRIIHQVTRFASS